MNKKHYLLIIAALFSTATIADELTALPTDVKAFVEKRDGCDHFRGEEPYDEERRRFLDENIKELCSGTDKALAELKNKYKDNANVIKQLSLYEENIEITQLEQAAPGCDINNIANEISECTDQNTSQ